MITTRYTAILDQSVLVYFSNHKINFTDGNSVHAKIGKLGGNKIYVRRNLRFRSVSDISRVKKKKTKQNKTKKLSVRDRFTWLRGLSTRTFVARRPRSQETRAQKFTYGFREVMKVRPAGWNDLQPSDVICGSSNGSLALGLTPKLVHGTRREKE